MRTPEDKRVKLLVGIINREDEERFTEIINEQCVALHFSGLGHGTAHSSYMTYFGFNEIDKRMTLSLIPERQEHEILSEIGHGLKLYLVGRGIGQLCAAVFPQHFRSVGNGLIGSHTGFDIVKQSVVHKIAPLSAA